MSDSSYEQAQARADRDKRTLGAEALGQARRRPLKTAVHDTGGRLSWIKLAGVSLALVPDLGLAPDEQNVGILLPAGRGGAIANLAVALAGRTSVNLNQTLGQEALTRMCEMAGVRTIICAHAYLDRIGPLDLPGRVLMAEDLLADLDKRAVIGAMSRVLTRPAGRLSAGNPDDVAALVFSSGSVGKPKGVQLTHRQILANCDAVMAHLDLRPGVDKLLTPLPLFHVFGLGPGLWLPLTKGFGIAAQADPRDGQALGRLSADTSPTFLISAPTFVRGYMRRVEPEQFSTLRFAIVGAEACPQELIEAFQERYDRPLYEGYGTTELSPAVSLNNPLKNRMGSVGTPLPGIEILTVDPRTVEPLPVGERGLIVVRSPARMLGYLGEPELTDRVFMHGGYNTGDIGWVDEDGFLYLTGRLARFAKIGGEMVPLDHVEATMQRYLDEEHDGEGLVAVASVGDISRGERLIVLHETLPCSRDELLGTLDGLPPLFRPKSRDVFEVESIPVLGSGKRDAVGIKRLANSLSGASDGGSMDEVQ